MGRGLGLKAEPSLNMGSSSSRGVDIICSDSAPSSFCSPTVHHVTLRPCLPDEDKGYVFLRAEIVKVDKASLPCAGKCARSVADQSSEGQMTAAADELTRDCMDGLANLLKDFEERTELRDRERVALRDRPRDAMLGAAPPSLARTVMMSPSLKPRSSIVTRAGFLVGSCAQCAGQSVAVYEYTWLRSSISMRAGG